MARHLIVTGAFADYQRGARITDPALVEGYLETHRAHVIPIEAPDEEEPSEAQPKPKAK